LSLQAHFLVYHAVQQAIGHALPATDWGWMKKDQLMIPILTAKPAAPEKLLKLVSCGCNAGCQRNDGCRKLGLDCTIMCSGCNGQTCTNNSQQADEANDMDNDMDTE